MNILAVSDVELGYLYSASVADRFKHIDAIISCGDLPYYYLEYIVSMLNRPLFYVQGNHASKVEETTGGLRTYPWGGRDLHQRCVRDDCTGLLMAGLEGSLQYNYGPHQYSQMEYWLMCLRLVPGLIYNRARHGRYLDIFVTHAPPWQIHDMDDLPHRGIKAFRWFDKTFKPAYHLHGHIHIYRQDTVIRTIYEQTTILNVFGQKEIKYTVPNRYLFASPDCPRPERKEERHEQHAK